MQKSEFGTFRALVESHYLALNEMKNTVARDFEDKEKSSEEFKKQFGKFHRSLI